MMILDRPCREPLKIERGTLRSVTAKYVQIVLYEDRRGFWHTRVQHATVGFTHWFCSRERRRAEEYFQFLCEEFSMSTTFTAADRNFLHACGIAVEPSHERLQDLRIPFGSEDRWGSDDPSPEECPECQTDFGMLHHPGCDIEEKVQLDSTEQTLLELGLPFTKENYLNLAFAGKPPEELDGEIIPLLPCWLQKILSEEV